MTKSEPPLTSAEVARVLGRSVRTVHRLVEDGVLPAMKLPGETGAYLFDPKDVEALAKQRAAS